MYLIKTLQRHYIKIALIAALSLSICCGPSYSLQIPLSSKSPCKIVKNPDGSFDVIENASDDGDFPDLPLKKTWAYRDICCLVRQSIDLQLPRQTLSFLIKSHLQSKKANEGLNCYPDYGFDTENIDVIKDEARIVGYTMAFYDPEKGLYGFTFSRNAGNAEVDVKVEHLSLSESSPELIKGIDLWQDPRIQAIERDLAKDSDARLFELMEERRFMNEFAAGEGYRGMYGHISTGISLIHKKMDRDPEALKNFLSRRSRWACPTFIDRYGSLCEVNLKDLGYMTLGEAIFKKHFDGHTEAPGKKDDWVPRDIQDEWRANIMHAVSELLHGQDKRFEHRHLHKENILVKFDKDYRLIDVKVIDWKLISAWKSDCSVLRDYLDGKRKDLQNANMRGNLLEGFDLKGVDMKGANLWAARCDWTDFRNADLRAANLEDIILRGTDFTGADLTGATLNGGAEVIGSRFVRTNFSQAKIGNIDFVNCDMSGSKFFDTHFGHSMFERAKLINADFRYADITYAGFWKADLRGADFRGAKISGISRFLEEPQFRSAYTSPMFWNTKFDKKWGDEFKAYGYQVLYVDGYCLVTTPGAKSLDMSELGAILPPYDNRPEESSLLNRWYIEHDMSVKEAVNSEDREIVGIYGAAGADISNFLISTNATKAYFVSDYFSMGLGDFKKLEDPQFFNKGYNDIVLGRGLQGYSSKYNIGFSWSASISTKEKILAALCYELRSMGVQQVIVDDDGGCARIRFKWAYHGKKEKDYSITFIHADIRDTAAYPNRLKEAMGVGFDIYYQRAAVNVSADYPKLNNYILQLYQDMRTGGFFVTDDMICEPYTDYGGHFPLDLKKIQPKGGMDIVNGILAAHGYTMDTITDSERMRTRYGWVMRVRQKRGEAKRDEPLRAVVPEVEFLRQAIFIGELSLTASKERRKPSFIALGTNWIKDYEKGGSPQFNALNPLMISIRKRCEEKGITFFEGEDEAVAGVVKGIKRLDPKARGIVLASMSTVNALDTGADENIIYAGVDNRNMASDSYVRLLEMLSALLEIMRSDRSMQDEIVRRYPLLGVNFMKAKHILFTPLKEPAIDYESQKKLYEIQTFA